MRIASIFLLILLLAGCTRTSAPAIVQATPIAAATPLILEKNEGEHRVFRPWPGHPEPGAAFTLKVDPRNGGSAHLVLGTEDLKPGEEIGAHQHPAHDEILYLAAGTARVQLGDTTRTVHGGATVFIPAGTWIAVSNPGTEIASLAFVFSSPGFEDFMRAQSAREGERLVPVSEAQDKELQKKYAHDIVFKDQ